MTEVIWERGEFAFLRRDCEEPDSFRYEYTIANTKYPWTQNPQELGDQGRFLLKNDEDRANFTMFLKNERYFNHYGVRL